MEQNILITWRGQNFVIDMNPDATLKDLGMRLQDLTKAKADTIRLLIPGEKGSKVLYPFSDEHARLSLDSMSDLKEKRIRMMGVPEEELEEVMRQANLDNRIAGFSEEERRLKQRSSYQTHASVKLPTGNYIFCDFRTLSLPGIELNPPAHKALELLHKLASDPGIVAIMNKYRWRVGIMTEMAPVGYVGVSPKCILGFNKNHGEEISLRLRTDDLKGFRKYESIKKTLLHELAHMVHSEHDQDFYALDKKLNREVVDLDWTKLQPHTLNRPFRAVNHEEEISLPDNVISSQKLGGEKSNLPDARSASASAALQRLANASLPQAGPSEAPITFTGLSISSHQDIVEHELHGYQEDESMETEPYSGLEKNISGVTIKMESEIQSQGEVEPDHTCSSISMHPEPLYQSENSGLESKSAGLDAEEMQGPDSTQALLRSQAFDSSQTTAELEIIQDPVTLFCSRLELTIQMLKDQLVPLEAQRVVQTLVKIIRNVIENPGYVKYRKLRKGNTTIQRNIIAYGAAVDILSLVGFFEDVVVDEWGKADTFFVLKRDDPGLLWLAKSSLEMHIQ